MLGEAHDSRIGNERSGVLGMTVGPDHILPDGHVGSSARSRGGQLENQVTPGHQHQLWSDRLRLARATTQFERQSIAMTSPSDVLSYNRSTIAARAERTARWLM